MTDWRSGLMLRTFLRLGLRAPFVLGFVLLFSWLNLLIVKEWNGWIGRLGINEASTPYFSMILALTFTWPLVMVSFAVMTMRRPLWERASIGLGGLVRGTVFGTIAFTICFIIVALGIGSIQALAPISETPRAYSLLHRSGILALTFLCFSPGIFALVVSTRERQGYSTITRVWRIDRGQTVRGIFLIALLTACVGGVACVAAWVGWGGFEKAMLYLGWDIDWFTDNDRARRNMVAANFTILAFVTAHIVQYERIRDWESGGDVSGVFD